MTLYHSNLDYFVSATLRIVYEGFSVNICKLRYTLDVKFVGG